MTTMSPGVSVGQELLDIGQEAITVHRTVEDGGRGDAVPAQCGDQSGGLPMSPRHL